MWTTPQTFWASSHYMNISDLNNRIEPNIEYLADLIETFQARPSVSVNTSWSIYDYPYSSEINRIESSIENIKDSIGEPVGWQTMITNWDASNSLNNRDFSRWEKNLLRLYNKINEEVSSFQVCGNWNFLCGRGNTLF